MNEHLETILGQLDEVWAVLQKPIFTLKDSKIALTNVIISVAVFLLSIKLAHYLGQLVNRQLKKKGVDSGIRDSLERFTRYTVIAVGVFFSLDNLGLSLNSLAAVGAVLMVGIGFGLQNVTQNFVSGIILLLERPVKRGDIVQVGETSGRVVDIRVRSTIIQTRDEVSIIVPNSKLVSEEVINESFSSNHHAPKKTRQHIKIGVSYAADVDQVQQLLTQAALNHERVLRDPAPRAVFMNFGDSALEFDLRYWLTDIWDKEVVAGDIRTAMIKSLRAAEIEIPFPQMDLNVKNREGSGL
ncbi:MAG: mechanosensitive ion channel [Bdellovibrionaceae bacterium]|nr:mechanosensitive ion channel [Pseudobdellovibrionaceae bacterium]